MRHVGEHQQACSRHCSYGRDAAAREDQAVAQAVDHQGRHAHLCERGRAVRAGLDREQLPDRAQRVDVARDGRAHHAGDLVGVEVWSGDEPEACDAEALGLCGVLGARRRHRERHRGQEPWGHDAVAAVARVGHDGAEAEHPLRVVDGQLLGDHPAHRHTDDVSDGHVEVVEQRHGILGHVRQEVVGLREPSVGERLEQRGPAGHRPLGLRRQADVPVVHPDDAEPALGQAVDDVAGPGHQLGTQTHEEQHRLAVLGAVHLVLDRHLPELRTGHDVSLAPRRGAGAGRPVARLG